MHRALRIISIVVMVCERLFEAYQRKPAQDQALAIKSVKYNLYKTSDTQKYKLGEKNMENVIHLISGCESFSPKNVYKQRHGKVCICSLGLMP